MVAEGSAPAVVGRAVATVLFTSSIARRGLNGHIREAVLEALGEAGLHVVHLDPDEILERDSLAGIDMLLYLGSSVSEAVPLGTLAAMAAVDGVVSIFWATDDPFELDARHRAARFDLYYSNDATAARHCPERPGMRHLPLAAAPRDRRRVRPLLERALPIFFCGYPYANRRLVVEDLLGATDLSREQLVVAGPDWNSPGLRAVRGDIGHDLLIDLYADSAFVLDIGRRHDLANDQLRLVATTPGPRTFEAALAGAPQLHVLQSEEVGNYFAPGDEILLVESVDEMVERVAWLRARPSEWLAIARAAQARAAQHHLYSHRIDALLRDLAVDGVLKSSEGRPAEPAGHPSPPRL